MKPKKLYILAIAIPLVSLLSAACGNTKTNTLTRPAANQDNTNATSQAPTDNGKVAGAQSVQYGNKNIKVGNLNLNVDVASDDASREQGLSGREKLDDGTGMLFDFTNTDFQKPGFWMKEMNFSIDIIWIHNGKVIGIQANAPLPPQDGDLPVYYPPSDINYVLEVPAGWSAKNKITVGTHVVI
ncbi:MAG TPA: DUF192 domain-containing protein [Patescibacteria group bacterium]|jgi:hypothetical protein|nr:DUF192 domain-containing protein [Patescibacteria group bacterium]